MGILNVEIPDPLDRRFRQAMFERLGGKKGTLQRAVIEAIELWIKAKS